MIVNIYFDKTFFRGALSAPLVKKMVIRYGGSYKKFRKNKKRNTVIITVDQNRKELLLFMLKVKSGVVQKI